MTMREIEALKLLSLWPTPEQVRSAFAEKVKAFHPDLHGDGGSMAHRDWTGELKQARDTLLGEVTKQNNTCNRCHGVGKVRGRWGTTPCPQCGSK